MFSSTATSVASSSFKKLGSRTKKSKPSIADSSALERRSWEAWNQREECIFFDSLVRNSRNWGAIAADIGSKRSEQVRLIPVSPLTSAQEQRDVLVCPCVESYVVAQAHTDLAYCESACFLTLCHMFASEGAARGTTCRDGVGEAQADAGHQPRFTC